MSHPVSGAAISVAPLSKHFSASQWLGGSRGPALVLDDINLEILPGEIFGLLGANGAGKTTLVEILATHLLPSSGQARISGHDVVSETELVRCLVGYCPASPDSFYPRLSARENLEFFATLYDVDSSGSRVTVSRLIRLVGLDEGSPKTFQQLSLGMKQRLGLARALLTDPSVLLLDEPTRSLDPAMQRDLHRLLREFVRQDPRRTILLVTHSFEEVAAVCDRVAILKDGRIVACGTQTELIAAAAGRDLADAFEHFAGHPQEAPRENPVSKEDG